jgi:DNA-binding transcriptional regulator of glucitol operon
MQATSSTNWRERLDDKKIIDGSILFSIIVSIAIVALGGWLTQFELATPPADDIGFFYEWQLAEGNCLGAVNSMVGFLQFTNC